MRKLVLFAVLFLSLCLLSFASAQIIISAPESIYNVGDSFNTSVKVMPLAATNGYLSVKLACDSGEVEIFKSPFIVQANAQRTIGIESAFDRSIIGDVNGICSLQASFGNENTRTSSFTLSKKINVDLNVSGIIVEPGQGIPLSGIAVKENGILFNGEARVVVSGLGIDEPILVTDGRFSGNVTLQADAPANNYAIALIVSEKDASGNVINSGRSESLFGVKQVVRRLVITTDKETLNPGESIGFIVNAYDQTNVSMIDDISLVVYQPNGNVFSKRIAKTGEQLSMGTETNFQPGYWKIEVGQDNRKEIKTFNVNELMKADFKLENDTLKVTNTGNIPYTKPVEILIGDTPELKELAIPIGESQTMALSAPDGVYNITIKTSSEVTELGHAYLTGNAISVGEAAQVIKENAKTILWIIIIFVIAAFAVNYYRKSSRTPTYSKYTGFSSSPANSNREIKRDVAGEKVKVSLPVASGMQASRQASRTQAVKERRFDTYGTRKAERVDYKEVRIDEGKKEESVVIAISFKNLHHIGSLKGAAQEEIDKVDSIAKYSGAKVYDDRNYKIIVLSPSLSGGNIESLISKMIKSGQSIRDSLVNHNRKFAQKIEFGMGMNTGELIVDKSGKFMSYGNTIVAAKRIADNAKSDLLLSSLAHRKSIGTGIKFEQVGGNWRILKIVDRAKHEEFIDRFMNRQSR
ncbi:MAG: hypothetical protein WCK90_01600 [archaeon]